MIIKPQGLVNPRAAERRGDLLDAFKALGYEGCALKVVGGGAAVDEHSAIQQRSVVLA